MEDNRFKLALLIAAAAILIPVLNTIYGLIPAFVTAAAILAAIVFLIAVMLTRRKKNTSANTELCSDIRSLTIEVKGRNYIVASGSGFMIEDAAAGGMLSFVEDGIWHIADDGSESPAPVEITLPSDFSPEELTIIVDKGNIISELRSAHNARINIHDGHAEIAGLRAAELNVSVGRGSLTFEGAVAVYANLLCGIGTLDVSLKNAEDYFNIEASVGMGSLTVGSENFNADRRIGTIDNGSNYNMEISVGMGTAKISFGEEQEI